MKWRQIGTMRIRVKLFAILRDRAGVGEVQIDLPEQATVGIAKAEIASRFPVVAGMMDRVAVAVNREYVKPECVLREGDELALIPAVSGG